tara:strand:+ start:5545 stop:5925 length:381 start_codon:yes stop_codon:yes gene_type:complete
MDIESPKKLLFCAMTACAHSDELRGDLVNLYEMLVKSNDIDPNFGIIKLMLDTLMGEFEQFQLKQGEEDIDKEGIEELNKAASAFLWIYRITNHVEGYRPLFDILENATEFNKAINETNQFLEDNQ